MSTTTISEEEITFKELTVKFGNNFRYLLKNWLVIVGLAMAGGIAGFFYARSKPELYIADTSFSLDEEKSSGNALMGLAASFGLDVGGGGNLFNEQNILQLFTSKKIIYSALLESADGDKITHADRLLKLADLKERTVSGSVFPPGLKPDRLTRTQDSIMALLHKKFISDYFDADKPDKQVDIYHVVVKTPDETLSASLSKEIVKKVSDLYTQIKTIKAQQTVEILQKRVDSLRNSYTRALYGQAAILDANINPTFRSGTVGAMQKQTEITTSTAAYQELLKNLEISKYSLLKQSPLFMIIDEPRMPLEKLKASGMMYAALGAFFLSFGVVVFLLFKRLIYNI